MWDFLHILWNELVWRSLDAFIRPDEHLVLIGLAVVGLIVLFSCAARSA